jgi:hypothetical protein
MKNAPPKAADKRKINSRGEGAIEEMVSNISN